MDKPARPIIIESSANYSNHPSFSKGLFNNLPRLLFLALAAIVVIEIIIGIKTLTRPVPASTKLNKLAGGKLVLISSKKEYKVGEQIPITIRLSSGGHTISGTDAVIKYDKDRLEATSSSAITDGKIFNEYPLKLIDSQAGTVQISGISTQTSNSFNGIGEFATINLVAKAAGRAKVDIEYTPKSTTDSNIIEENTVKDILDQVFNIQLDIKQ